MIVGLWVLVGFDGCLCFWFVYLVIWFSFLLSLDADVFACCAVGVLVCIGCCLFTWNLFWDNLLGCFVWCWFGCFVCLVMYVICEFGFGGCVVF